MKIFIIGEIGINHNGDLKLAKKLIEGAKNSGADAVKFQKRTVELVYTKEALSAHRDSPWGKTNEDQKKGIELKEKDYDEIDKFCKKIKIEWFASCWDVESLKFLKKYKCKYNKIASAMLTHFDLLEEVAKEKKHTFISTGMHDLEEIKTVVEIFKKHKCSFELMHTVSTYPMKVENANLNMIKTLKKMFNCNVGYSGHEVGRAVSVAAAAIGISSLERHITLDRAMWGTDQSASLGPEGLGKLLGMIKKIDTILGDGKKKLLEEEYKKSKDLRYW